MTTLFSHLVIIVEISLSGFLDAGPAPNKINRKKEGKKEGKKK
jgi:hypothetical protein